MLKTKMLVAVVALLGIMAESHEGHPWREHQEDRILRAAGFEPEEEGDLWRRRSGLLFGREAALQVAFRELRERGEGEVSDET